MLRAWYSPRARGGMTPFEFLPILADELVAIMPDRNLAKHGARPLPGRTRSSRCRPSPMARATCRRSSSAAARRPTRGDPFGRTEMSYFLGVAYQKGATAPQDAGLAARWLQRAADMGSRPALARLGAGGFNAASGS